MLPSFLERESSSSIDQLVDQDSRQQQKTRQISLFCGTALQSGRQLCGRNGMNKTIQLLFESKMIRLEFR